MLEINTRILLSALIYKTRNIVENDEYLLLLTSFVLATEHVTRVGLNDQHKIYFLYNKLVLCGVIRIYSRTNTNLYSCDATTL